MIKLRVRHLRKKERKKVLKALKWPTKEIKKVIGYSPPEKKRKKKMHYAGMLHCGKLPKHIDTLSSLEYFHTQGDCGISMGPKKTHKRFLSKKKNERRREWHRDILFAFPCLQPRSHKETVLFIQVRMHAHRHRCRHRDRNRHRHRHKRRRRHRHWCTPRREINQINPWMPRLRDTGFNILCDKKCDMTHLLVWSDHFVWHASSVCVKSIVHERARTRLIPMCERQDFDTRSGRLLHTIPTAIVISTHPLFFLMLMINLGNRETSYVFLRLEHGMYFLLERHIMYCFLFFEIHTVICFCEIERQVMCFFLERHVM